MIAIELYRVAFCFNILYRVHAIGIFTKKITYCIFLVPLAGIVHQTGVSNSSHPGNVSLGPGGIGVVPNSMPRVWVLAFQGLDERAQFSSHIAIHGKSCWRKQYPTPKRRLSPIPAGDCPSDLR